MRSGQPTIFVYDSVASPAGQRGVNRYFLKFVDALVRTYNDRVRVYSQRNLHISKKNQLKPASNQVYLGRFLRKHLLDEKLDRFYAEQIANLTASAFYSPYFGTIKTKIPSAYTLPDMIYEKFPQYFLPADVGVRNFIAQKRACFERAALILPISKSAAKDLQEYYPNLSSERIKVIYLGIDDLFFKPHLLDKPERPYFLFVGNRDRYKNFLRFIDAFGKSGLKKNFDLRIVSPVQNNFNANENEMIMRHKLENCIKVEYAISDEALKKCYAEAHTFVYPTEYEGFGLPVIEALSCGTLVLTSNTSSLTEVGGAAPMYFDPHSIDSITNTLQIASQMPDSVRQERILTGKNWAAQFTWKNSQRSFVTAIQELLKEV
jgi:glycosyltransferase involved in cell wall biosynthesis